LVASTKLLYVGLS